MVIPSSITDPKVLPQDDRYTTIDFEKLSYSSDESS